MKTRRYRLVVVALAVAFTIISLGPVFAGQESWRAAVKSPADLDNLIRETARKADASPGDASLLLSLARMEVAGGRYPEAEGHLAETLRLGGRKTAPLLVLADLQFRTYRLDDFDRTMAEAWASAPDDPEFRLLEARSAFARMDFASSRAIYEDLARRSPSSPLPLLGLAEVLYEEQRLDEAKALAEKALALDRGSSRAYSLLAQIARFRQDNDVWKSAAEKAVELDPLDPEARVRRAFVLTRLEGKLREGYEEVRTALKLDPFCHSAYSFLGNGGTPYDYREQPAALSEEAKAYAASVSEEAKAKVEALIAQGDRDLLAHRYPEALAAAEAALALDPRNVTALIWRGSALYHLKRFEEALASFRRALDANPDYGLAHYGLSQVLLRMKDRRNVKLPEMEKVFAGMDAPEPEGLRDVFLNYAECDEELQRIIRLSVAPLSGYMKTLKIAGATYYIQPFHRFLWQSPKHAGLRGRRTFDLRLWDDVKGVGGFHAVAAADWQRDFKYFRTNVLLHEFTHQVHQFLSREEREEVKRLFLKAKKERRTLTYYADYNEMEYLAVAVPAYAAEIKLGPGYTREDLRRIDPDLYAFIDKMNRKASYRENEIQAYLRKAQSALREEGPEAALAVHDEAAAAYGAQAEILVGRGAALRLKGDPGEARAMFDRARREFPKEAGPAVALAEDIVYAERDSGRALALLAEAASAFPNSFDVFAKRAEIALAAGRPDEAAEAARRALEIDPYSAPAYVLLARSSFYREDYEEAEKAFQKAFAISKLDASAFADLALLLLEKGASAESETALETARSLGPNDPRVREVRAVFAARRGDVQAALDILDTLIQDRPDRLEAYTLYADLALDSRLETAWLKAVEAIPLVAEKGPVTFVRENANWRAKGLHSSIAVSHFFSALARVVEKMAAPRGGSAARLTQEWAYARFPFNFRSALALAEFYVKEGRKADAGRILQDLRNRRAPAKYVQAAERALR
jgi:tetratricopeptide (TPR) repeat protein